MFGILVFCVVIVSCCFSAPVEDSGWQFFVFTQEWAPTLCQDETFQDCSSYVSSHKPSWTIHGLWPSSSHNKKYTCTINYPFNMSEIQSLRTQLNTDWPNLKGGPIDNFWAHEWGTHGKCATTLPATSTEYKYFSQTMQLLHQYDILSLLESSGISPSKSKSYQMSDILKALGGKDVTIECYKHYIMQIEMCLDKQFQQIDCPQYTTSSCGDQAYYLPFQDNQANQKLVPVLANMRESVYHMKQNLL